MAAPSPLDFTEEQSHVGPLSGWLMLKELAEAQNISIPYSQEVSPGHLEESVMDPARQLS